MVQSLLCDVKFAGKPVSHDAVISYDVLLQEVVHLRSENAQLQARLDALGAENAQLRARLDALEARTDANKTAADAAAPGS